VTKIALTDVRPTMLPFARLALAYLILRPLVARSGGRPARGPLSALLGLTGFAGFVLLRNLGLGTAPELIPSDNRQPQRFETGSDNAQHRTFFRVAASDAGSG
jgi:hypothetical protein